MSVLKIGASNVRAFVGLGGPYWNADGTVSSTAASALGIKLESVTFGLVLMKPVTTGAASPLSYYALKATIGTVALVTPPAWGLTLSATGVPIEVNSSNDPGHVVDLSGMTIQVPTGDSSHIDIGGNVVGGPDWSTALLQAAGHVVIGVAGLSLSADVWFQSTTRANGTRVVKIHLGNLSFKVGDDPLHPIFQISGVSGNIFLGDEGFAAEFSVPVSFQFGDPYGSGTTGVAFSAQMEMAINTIPHAIDETFIVGAGTEHLTLEAGPYLRFAANGVHLDIAIGGVKAILRGDFVFEQITVTTGGTPEKVIRIAAANVRMGQPEDSDVGPTLTGATGAAAVRLSNGHGAVILFKDGVAGVFGAPSASRRLASTRAPRRTCCSTRGRHPAMSTRRSTSTALPSTSRSTRASSSSTSRTSRSSSVRSSR
jgi:hypothetical protein